MYIKFYVTSDKLSEVFAELSENLIQIDSINLTEHGNYELTVLCDRKDQVKLVADLYFG